MSRGMTLRLPEAAGWCDDRVIGTRNASLRNCRDQNCEQKQLGCDPACQLRQF